MPKNDERGNPDERGLPLQQQPGFQQLGVREGYPSGPTSSSWSFDVEYSF